MNDPASLLKVDGVLGLCVHSGADICWKRLPVSLTTGQADALCAAVQGAFAAYAGAERQLTEACFEFSGQTVLVVARPPAAGATAEHFLTFLLKSPAAAAVAAEGARSWLKANPEFKKPPPRPASPLMMQRKK